MPIHDWTRVEAGDFHHFHQRWIQDIAAALNTGLSHAGGIRSGSLGSNLYPGVGRLCGVLEEVD